MQRTSPEERILPETLQGFLRNGGRVPDATKALFDGDKAIMEIGLTTKDNRERGYLRERIKSGTHTLRVQSDTTVRQVPTTVPAPSETANPYNIQLV